MDKELYVPQLLNEDENSFREFQKKEGFIVAPSQWWFTMFIRHHILTSLWDKVLFFSHREHCIVKWLWTNIVLHFIRATKKLAIVFLAPINSVTSQRAMVLCNICITAQNCFSLIAVVPNAKREWFPMVPNHQPSLLPPPHTTHLYTLAQKWHWFVTNL